MTIQRLEIPDTWLYTPKIYRDERGEFFEWFQNDTYKEYGPSEFLPVQANCSLSKKGTLRGIHFALLPDGQRKHVTCLRGSIIDVLVDLRIGSPMYGKWIKLELNSTNRFVISIPNGVGHGFVALEDETIVSYLCDRRYNPNNEREINPLDLNLDIAWPKNIDLVLSQKDINAPSFIDIQPLLSHYNPQND